MASKILPKSFLRFALDGLVFDLVASWSQDGSKTVPRGLLGESLGPSWGGLGLLLGALGPSLDGLGGVLGVVLVSFWVVLGFDSLIRFIDSIY